MRFSHVEADKTVWHVFAKQASGDMQAMRLTDLTLKTNAFTVTAPVADYREEDQSMQVQGPIEMKGQHIGVHAHAATLYLNEGKAAVEGPISGQYWIE